MQKFVKFSKNIGNNVAKTLLFWNICYKVAKICKLGLNAGILFAKFFKPKIYLEMFVNEKKNCKNFNKLCIEFANCCKFMKLTLKYF